MRALGEKIAELVDNLILQHGETAFLKTEIIEMVKESMKADGSFTDFELG